MELLPNEAFTTGIALIFGILHNTFG